jgi:hypothetical protein
LRVGQGFARAAARVLPGGRVPWYIGTNSGEVLIMAEDRLLIQRVQTGVRVEKRLLKVLKAFAEYQDMTLGDLLEGIVGCVRLNRRACSVLKS